MELTAYEGLTQVDSTSLDIQILHDPFEQQNPLSGRDQRVGQGAAAGAGAHDDHVIVLSHLPILGAPGRADLTRSG